MKQITLKIGPMGNADTVVLDENGEIMDSVRKVEVISEAEEITVARVTFAFPRISGSARSQEPCSLSMLGSDYETKVIPEAGSSRPSE